MGRLWSALVSLVVVSLGGALGAVAGGAAGCMAGVANPVYYRTVLPSGGEPWFDPVQVGVGLGVAQGIKAGLVVGGGVVVLPAWRRFRRGHRPEVVVNPPTRDR